MRLGWGSCSGRSTSLCSSEWAALPSLHHSVGRTPKLLPLSGPHFQACTTQWAALPGLCHGANCTPEPVTLRLCALVAVTGWTFFLLQGCPCDRFASPSVAPGKSCPVHH